MSRWSICDKYVTNFIKSVLTDIIASTMKPPSYTIPSNVHHVRNVHPLLYRNDLTGERWGEHLSNNYRNVHHVSCCPTTGGEHGERCERSWEGVYSIPNF